MKPSNRCFSLPPRVFGFFLLIITGCPLIGYSQISPFTPGDTRSAIENDLLHTRSAQGLEIIQETSEQWILEEVDESGYRLKVQVDFDDALAQKILTEWTATTVDYRVILRKWFDQEIAERGELVDFERDPRMEEMLINSYKDGRAKAAIWVSLDKSQRIILIFHSTQEGAFLSHMHQVYFWPE